MDLDNDYLIKTSIYSDSFAFYQIKDFKQMGFILKKANYRI